MTGANNEVVDTLAKEFNDSQKEYKITPVFKGTYPETLNAGIAAFRAKQPPAIIQVFDAGSGVMMGAAGAIKPVADVLKEGGYTFNKADYLAGIVAYYSKPDGTMLSFLTIRPRRSSITTRMSSRRPASMPPTHRRPGRKFSKPPRRSRPAVPRSAVSPPHGSPGFRPKTSPPGTTSPMAAMKTALAARM